MPKIFASGISYLARYIAIFSTLLLGACATVDFDYPKEESHALVATETSGTYLGKKIMAAAAEHPGESGFYLQFDGIDALAGRFVLAKYAEKTIDAQYYLITSDKVGMLFIGALLQAADRGVRVRLLLDDIQTQGYDAGMAALDSHPNFEVRIFNPWASRSARSWMPSASAASIDACITSHSPLIIRLLSSAGAILLMSISARGKM